MRAPGSCIALSMPKAKKYTDALKAAPSQVFTAMALVAILSAPARSRAPRWWVMTTLVPIPMKLKATRKKMMTWLATPRAATAPSETWLTMNVSTVPMSIRSVCSTKMGHAIPRRASLAGGERGHSPAMNPARRPLLHRHCLRMPAVALACILGSGLACAQQPPPVVSPEVLPDGRVTFRILAPKAESVAVQGLRHLPAQPMAKDAAGLWSVTVGPLAPDIYSYTLSIDGATVTDPHDRDIKKYFSSESLFEVPGNPPILASVQPVPHGSVHHQFYASAARGGDAGVWVYTPPGYDPRAPALYPVVYLLHGFGDREESWIDSGRAN